MPGRRSACARAQAISSRVSLARNFLRQPRAHYAAHSHRRHAATLPNALKLFLLGRGRLPLAAARCCLTVPCSTRTREITDVEGGGKLIIYMPSTREADILSGKANYNFSTDEPTFCCCEFIDRYGERKHLGDASACDDCLNACCSCSPLAASRVLAELDDRMRIPQFNGAVHAGFDGMLPVVLLPLLGRFAARGPYHALLLLVIAPPLLALVHVQTLKARRQPRFFVGWTSCTYLYGNFAFTLLVGEHFHFGWWVASAALQAAAAACASATRAPPHGRSRGGAVR